MRAKKGLQWGKKEQELAILCGQRSNRMLNQERNVGHTEKIKNRKKICKCNWKAEGFVPTKTMESHWSNARLGPLL